MARSAPGVRFLPNAITVLALCAGLTAVQFALTEKYGLCIAAIGVAAVLDALDGRIARLLDATSKMGAELDSLADGISFGVAPALVIYIWSQGGANDRFGWVAALVFAVCMILRLARFNTLLDDNDQPPYASEFFVGVPAPAGGLLALMPIILQIEFGGGWWTEPLVVWTWTIAIAALLISRIPTLSLKTIRVPAKALAPLLVGVGLLAAAIMQYPLIVLGCAMLIYLAHLPYSIYRHSWLARHPEAWEVPARERRAIRRRGRRARGLGLRPPALRGKIAGTSLRMRLPRNGNGGPARGSATNGVQSASTSTGTTTAPTLRRAPSPNGPANTPRARNWRRLGLRQRGR